MPGCQLLTTICPALQGACRPQLLAPQNWLLAPYTWFSAPCVLIYSGHCPDLLPWGPCQCLHRQLLVSWQHDRLGSPTRARRGIWALRVVGAAAGSRQWHQRRWRSLGLLLYLEKRVWGLWGWSITRKGLGEQTRWGSGIGVQGPDCPAYTSNLGAGEQ